jgi:hypothetical protein
MFRAEADLSQAISPNNPLHGFLAPSALPEIEEEH